MNESTVGHGFSCWFVRQSQECVMLWNILEIVFGLKISYYSIFIICTESRNSIAFIMYTLSSQLSMYTKNIQMEG